MVKNITVKLLKDGPSNSTVFVLGATGSGKTTLIANLLLDRQRFVIFDTRNEYSLDFFHVKGTYPPTIVTNAKDFCEALNSGTYRIIYKFSHGNEDEMLSGGLSLLYEFQSSNSEAG